MYDDNQSTFLKFLIIHFFITIKFKKKRIWLYDILFLSYTYMYMIIYINLTTFKTKGKKSTVSKDLLKQNDKIHFTGKNNTVVNFK